MTCLASFGPVIVIALISIISCHHFLACRHVVSVPVPSVRPVVVVLVVDVVTVMWHGDVARRDGHGDVMVVSGGGGTGGKGGGVWLSLYHTHSRAVSIY